MRRCTAGFVAILSLIASAGAAPAQVPERGGAAQAAPATDSPARRDAAARIRKLYFQSLYEQAIAAERALERAGHASPESHAWAIAAMAEYGMHDDALAAAHLLARRDPGDAWADFALALAHESPADTTAMHAAARIRAADPWSRDFVWLQARVLSRRNARSSIEALMDSAWTRVTPDAALYVARAGGLRNWIPGAKPVVDTASRRRQVELLDSALALDSTLYDAWNGKANAYASRGMRTQAIDAGRRAALAIPSSPRAHELFWIERRQISGTIPTDTLVSDVQVLLTAADRSPGALLTSSTIFGQVGMADRAGPLESELLRRFPRSFEAEQVQLRRIEGLSERILTMRQTDPVTVGRFRRIARAFTAAPGRRPNTLGKVYELWLYAAAEDAAVPPAEVRTVLEGALRYGAPDAENVRPAMLKLLALPDSRALVHRMAARYLELSQAHRHFNMPPGTTDTAAELRRRQRADTGVIHDLFAWQAFKAGQVDAAAAELQAAIALAPDDPTIRYHLGLVAERRGNLVDAAAAYEAGLQHEQASLDRPNLRAARALLRRPGITPASAQGIEAALAADRENRRAAVLAQRLPQRKALPPLRLVGLDAGAFTPDSLRGRVAVIDFWATWCGPCIRELPQIQKLHDRYLNDRGVAVISVNLDADAQLVRSFLNTRHFTFPVLQADSLTQANIHGLPETWFVDEQGRIAYDLIGGAADPDDFFDALLWRIESLREQPLKAAPKAAGGT